MKSITSKLVVGMLASLAATGMTGGAAFAVSSQTPDMLTHPQSAADKVVGRVSYARAVVVNVAREAQRQADEGLGKTL